jgi:hypothetical protein
MKDLIDYIQESIILEADKYEVDNSGKYVHFKDIELEIINLKTDKEIEDLKELRGAFSLQKFKKTCLYNFRRKFDCKIDTLEQFKETMLNFIDRTYDWDERGDQLVWGTSVTDKWLSKEIYSPVDRLVWSRVKSKNGESYVEGTLYSVYEKPLIKFKLKYTIKQYLPNKKCR